ncbi:MAG: hypothetical protein CBCREVIR_3368 [Candidatus Burkholderia crenata]|nr:MAG: hypothetical protein CBCREVIR_3368 [Candidatus Burkholderia crenata]
MPNAMNQPLPVTVLAGLPAVGKNTLLVHHAGMSIAVVRGRIDDLSSTASPLKPASTRS